MRNTGWIFSFVVVVAMCVVGCEKESATPSTPATPATPSTPAVPAAAKDAAADTSAAAKEAAAGATDATKDATAAAKETAAGAADATKTAAAGATDAAANASSAVSAESQKLLDQALAYIKDNKLDLAEKSIAQLEGMKASLPAAFQSKVADARKLLDTTKAAAGALKAPALPGASQ